MNWLKTLLENIVLKIGLLPLLEFCVGWLKEKAMQTEMKADDYGVEILEKVVESKEITIDNFLVQTTAKLKELATETDIDIDDIVANALHTMAVNGTITLNALILYLHEEIKSYIEETETEYDDWVYITLLEVLKQTPVKGYLP